MRPVPNNAAFALLVKDAIESAFRFRLFDTEVL